MLLRYLHELSGHQRNQRADRHLGYSLAFVGGAVNAGGFLAIGQYTSHVTGIISSMADHLALGDLSLALAAMAAWLSFLVGASATAILINLARRRRLRSRFALSLLVEAALLLLFGLAGAYLADRREFLAPVTVLLLCFIMGLQNAIITKVSGAVIRTTHVTGLLTDLGIELGKLLYINRRDVPHPMVRADRDKLSFYTFLVLAFFVGGIIGALGFKHIGYASTIPLAACLALLAIGPIWGDLRARWRVYRRQRMRGRND
ncbi:MAG: hypothetical protein K0R43_1578 [Pseudoduganella sp.]|jgi:uncharacterized membrane protein YoaK (UPF0700 family)|nr:hypothetical protein [Pseudoduganella sp.]